MISYHHAKTFFLKLSAHISDGSLSYLGQRLSEDAGTKTSQDHLPGEDKGSPLCCGLLHDEQLDQEGSCQNSAIHRIRVERKNVNMRADKINDAW